MKILHINALSKIGSTGKIVDNINKLLYSTGNIGYTCYSQNTDDRNFCYKFSNKFLLKINAVSSRVFGNFGFEDIFSTKRLIKKIKKIKPDIIHLHNIHSHDVNLKKLLKFLNKANIKIVWTFHDCWALTGYCTHFDGIGCKKWISGCFECPVKREYSWFFDCSKNNYVKKKNILTNTNFDIVVPSNWLKQILSTSYLNNKKIHVIPNGIDLTCFKPTQNKFREKYKISDDKTILLFVAFKFTQKKGVLDIIKLSNLIDHNKFQIVIVGEISDLFKRAVSPNAIFISNLFDKNQLAEIYSSSDVLLNFTYEDTFPTVNIEAISCGLPIITYKTGGSPEIIDDKSGYVVKKGDIMEVLKILESNKIMGLSKKDCIVRSKLFDFETMAKKYIDLYKKMLDS